MLGLRQIGHSGRTAVVVSIAVDMIAGRRSSLRGLGGWMRRIGRMCRRLGHAGSLLELEGRRSLVVLVDRSLVSRSRLVVGCIVAVVGKRSGQNSPGRIEVVAGSRRSLLGCSLTLRLSLLRFVRVWSIGTDVHDSKRNQGQARGLNSKLS